MLINNYSYINQICGHNHSGITHPTWIMKPHSLYGYYSKDAVLVGAGAGSNIVYKDSFPTGTNPPYSYILGHKGALLSSTTMLLGDGEITSSLSQGINIESSLTGVGTISNASLALVVSLASGLLGNGNISGAALIGTVGLAGTLTSTGNITAGLNVVAFMNSALSGTGTINGNLKGLLTLSSDIYVNESTFTVNQLVEGVWNALAASYNTAGTMGAAMNAAGVAGDPWIATLPGAYPPGSAGDILGNMLANIPDSVWDELKATHNTADSYGKIVQDLETLAKQIKALTSANL